MHMNLPPTTPKNPHHTQNPKPQTRKWCFRCESCKTKLSTGTGNYRITNGKNFCHICYDKLFNLAKKQKYSVFGMSDEEQSKLVKYGNFFYYFWSWLGLRFGRFYVAPGNVGNVGDPVKVKVRRKPRPRR